MSAAPAKSPIRETSRLSLRHNLTVPVDITTLRSGVPYRIPGRGLNLSEGGLGAVAAGEFHPGDVVGLEFRLPDASANAQLKAVVRYQRLLVTGFEFVALPVERRVQIQYWAERNSTLSPPALRSLSAESPSPPVSSAEQRTSDKSRFGPWLRGLILAFVIFAATATAVAWRWHRIWRDLEPPLTPAVAAPGSSPVVLPSDLAETLITERTEPIYPEAARQAHIQGTVTLSALIGAEGTVTGLRAISGPELLKSAAIDAVRQWKFTPYFQDGQPVQVSTTISVDFRQD